MAEKVTAGPITSANGVREAVCIHTKKIFSSCKDKDCIEDLTFYPTATAQSVIDASQSIRGGRVELLHVGVDVEPVSFNRGFFTVDMRFYYRVILQAVNNGMRATEIEGLATFDKRVMLFGHCRGLRRAHSLRAADQARVHLHRTVLHRAARARHTAAHSGVRLLHPERQLPAGRQHFVQLLRRSLRDVRECLLPGGRFLPRRHRGGRRGHADELLQLRRQIKATSAKRRELPPLFSSSAFFQANRHDLSTPRIEWGI